MAPQQGRMMEPMAGGGAMMSGTFQQGYQGAPQSGTMMAGGMPPQTGFIPGQSTGQPTAQYASGSQRYGCCCRA